MGLGREEAIAGLLAEYEAFGALVRSLDKQQWEQPSRCAGWTAGDVARHVVGTAQPPQYHLGGIQEHLRSTLFGRGSGRSEVDGSHAALSHRRTADVAACDPPVLRVRQATRRRLVCPPRRRCGVGIGTRAGAMIGPCHDRGGAVTAGDPQRANRVRERHRPGRRG